MHRRIYPNLQLPTAAIAFLAAVAALVFCLIGSSPADAKKRTETCTPSPAAGLGEFGPVQPDACWRPYAADSPFNTRLPNRAAGIPGSRGIVKRLATAGPINSIVAGDPEKDYGIPSYFADAGDPTYTVVCTEDWGPCDIEGMQMPIPDGAAPSGVWPLEHKDDFYDSHLTIVDQSTGWEWDLWNVREIGNGQVVTSWGGRTRIDGDGLGSDAVASQFGSLAGTIRPEELAAGQIRHALVLNVPCTNGYVWPAMKGAMECKDTDLPAANAPAVGQLLRLKISNRKISKFPIWKQAILRAFRDYGAYVSDTTAVEDQWNLRIASSAHYNSFGSTDVFTQLAKNVGLSPEDYNDNGHPEYWFDLGSGVNWAQMRVVQPPR